MKILRKIIHVSYCLTLCIGLQSAYAMDSSTQYRFAGMLPSTQPWDFNGGSIAIAPDGSFWLAERSPSRVQHVYADGSLISQFSLPALPQYAYVNTVNIALATDGSIWVSRGEHIQHFSATGSLIKAFTSDRFITALAIANDGSVWLASGNRLLHFTAEGNLITQAKNPACPTATLTYNPESSMRLADGSVWVADFQNNRMQHLTKDGKLLTEINNLKSVNVFGNVNAWFTVTEDNTLWVETDLKLFQFSADGKLIHINKSGACQDNVDNALGISVAPDGSLWVNNDLNAQIQHYAADGQFIAAIDRENNERTLLSNITVTSNGSFWVIDRIVDFAKGNSVRLQHLQADGRLISQFTAPFFYAFSPDSLAVATDGSIWRASSEAPGSIQHYQADGSLIAHFGAGNGIGQFTYPSNLRLTSNKSIWVFYPHNDQRLQHFDASGGFIEETIPDTNVYDSFKSAVASDGSQWRLGRSQPYCICDIYDTIEHISADGRLLGTIRGLPWNQKSIKVAADGSLWVVSHTNGVFPSNKDDYFWHLSTDGSVITKIKGSGGIAPLADGSVWIANAENNRIQHFAADGSLLSQFGSRGTGPGQFKNPQDIAVDADGSIWVADTNNHRIQKFSPKTLANYPAEYDDKNGLLYLDDVAVEGTHYQATLQLQHGAYRLLTQLPALNTYSPAASFNAVTNLLSIPLARAFGQDYQAQFQYLGDSLFQLQSAKTK